MVLSPAKSVFSSKSAGVQVLTVLKQEKERVETEMNRSGSPPMFVGERDILASAER